MPMISSPTPPTIWVLVDDRTGNTAQAIGVAERLGLPYERKQIVYNGWVRLHNALRGRKLLGVDIARSDLLAAPWPDIVIAAGRRLAPVARFIRKASGRKARLVQLMHPECGLKDFTLVAVPEHDRCLVHGPIVTTLGAPHRVTASLLAEEAERWRNRFADYAPPYVAVLIGGASRKGRLTIKAAAQLAEQASHVANQMQGTLLVTTSRRTDPQVVEVFQNRLTCPFYLHDWQQGGENPYFAFLGLSEAIIVTGDSMSMCSEAAATGKPVFIFSPRKLASKKHRRLHEALYENGYAKPLTGEWENWSYTPLDTSGDVAELVRERCFSS